MYACPSSYVSTGMHMPQQPCRGSETTLGDGPCLLKPVCDRASCCLQRAFRDSPVSAFHLALGTLGWQTHSTTSTFLWLLWIWTQTLHLQSRHFSHGVISSHAYNFWNTFFHDFCHKYKSLHGHDKQVWKEKKLGRAQFLKFFILSSLNAKHHS